jgi:hypothetical protein
LIAALPEVKATKHKAAATKLTIPLPFMPAITFMILFSQTSED